MGTKLNPYLNFAGETRAAMQFYADVLGGELAMHTFGEYGDPGAENADGIMHASLETPDGNTLMASDTPPGFEMASGTPYISLSGDDAEALRGYWARLSDGGQVMMALEKQIWGDDYGLCVDRFGVGWHISIAGQPG